MLAIAARSALILCLACACPALVHAAQCGQTPGGFDAWLASFKQEAAAQGISQRTITTALTGVTYDPAVIARDRRQGVFNQSFEEFSGRMVPPRLNKGADMMRQPPAAARPRRVTSTPCASRHQGRARFFSMP